jgi:5-methyltetrahydropteroyltriglutamate--homocysteine methyltransferase
MKSSTNRILTSHVGSLPRPEGVLRLIFPKETGQAYDRDVHARGMHEAVRDIVRRQEEIGIDVVNDGEQTKSKKLRALTEGAKIASRQLWGRAAS